MIVNLRPRPSNEFLNICNVSATALKKRSLSSDGLLANQCDQRRLACSVGGSPTGVRVRTP